LQNIKKSSINNTFFSKNIAGKSGGAIYGLNSNVSLFNTKIQNNSAKSGGGNKTYF
jgi:predicted outer membrane repeat protein